MLPLTTPRVAPRRGFSLVELLVVIAIIGLLIAILLPALARVRGSARDTACLSNIRQVLAAVGSDVATNGGRLPENRFLVGDPEEAGREEYVTWRHRYAEEGLLPAGGEDSVWVCPAHPEPGPRNELEFAEDGATCVGDLSSSYAVNGHILWRYEKRREVAVRSDTVVQRPSHTVLIAETASIFSDIRASDLWIAKDYGNGGGAHGFWHNGDGAYAFLDGHAEFIRLLDTGSPDCRWHNGADLTINSIQPQPESQKEQHDHPDWRFLVQPAYLR